MCFVAGTKVKTFDGDKNIEDIEAGDFVFSKNTETGETGYKLVEEVFQNETPEIIRLEIAGEVIETTANHPFWVSGYGFKNAGCLKTGDVIETIDGNLYPVLSAERFYPTEDVKVYNFRVADWHTYYVSEIGILVHNDKCGPDVARRSESGSKTYKNSSDITKDIRQNKPLNSPAIDAWYGKNGTISIDENGVWTYHDWEGNSVSYSNGYPDFKSAGMVRQEAPIGPFVERNKDFAKAREMGYIKSADGTWHHHEDGVTLQEVETILHDRFRHRGGISNLKKK